MAKSTKSAAHTKKPAAASKAKPAAKSASKSTGKSPEKKVAAKAPKKHEPASKAAKADGKAPAKSASTSKASTPAGANSAASAAGKKAPPKGITVVQQKPLRRPKLKPKLEMPVSEPLIKPGMKFKPLIPSGPKAPPTGLVGQSTTHSDPALLTKNRLNKKELDKYREVLLRKRAELIGDVANIEDEALRQNSGSLSSLPQHMAEQGSDTFEQSISLDLAQVDRNLIRSIDEAIKRIDAGTYGLCLRTGQRISADRLAEIPWAKYSIEAQRELERGPYRE